MDKLIFVGLLMGIVLMDMLDIRPLNTLSLNYGDSSIHVAIWLLNVPKNS